MATKYIFYSIVSKVEEKFENYNWHKNADGKSECDRRSLGWYVWLGGLSDSWRVSAAEPELKAGDKIKMTWEKN